MSDAPAPAFSAWEREIALRYLRARRDEGGVALISVISFVGITLAVAVLIIVISVMPAVVEFVRDQRAAKRQERARFWRSLIVSQLTPRWLATALIVMCWDRSKA